MDGWTGLEDGISKKNKMKIKIKKKIQKTGP